ncbi:unnamed protein product, partial [Rotaria socialis]
RLATKRSPRRVPLVPSLPSMKLNIWRPSPPKPKR